MLDFICQEPVFVVLTVILPHSEYYFHPFVGKKPQCMTMRFPHFPVFLVVKSRPWAFCQAAESKKLHRVSEWLTASKAELNLGIITTLLGYRRCSSQSSYIGNTLETATVVTILAQHTRGKILSCSRET